MSAVGAGALMWAAVTAGATSAPPSAMTSQVEDRTTDQLMADQLSQVQQARERVVDETEFDLWVVYVDDFDGMDSFDWANQVAVDSGADTDVLLLAIAEEGRNFGFSVAREAALSDAQVTDIEETIDEELVAGDLAGAATSAADAIIEISDSRITITAVLPWILAGIGAVVVVLWLRSRSRRGRPGTRLPPPPQQREAGPWAGTTTAELGQRAGSALVDLDNDIRSSANELQFAQAQFGIEATKEFVTTLESGKQQLAQAFELQRGISNDQPEQQQRQSWIQILQLCQAADAALDDQVAAMEQLRNLQQRVPEVLAELDQRSGELHALIGPARTALSQLGATYPASALTSVAQAADQAQALVTSAKQAIVEGQSRLQAQDRGGAVAYARTAEAALGQVATLIETVNNAEQALTQAINGLDQAVASLTSDLAEAARLAPSDSTVSPLVTRAQAAITAASNAKNGGDPIAALTELTAAEQALDAALAPYRAAADTQARAATNAQELIGQAQAAVGRANQLVDLTRGRASMRARAELAAAQASLAQAQAELASQPERAAATAQQAIAQAQAALQLAAADASGVPRERAYGGGYYGRSSGVDADSLILGGLLRDTFTSGRSRRNRSSWGADYWSRESTGRSGTRTTSGWGGSRSNSGGGSWWSGGSSSSRSSGKRKSRSSSGSSYRSSSRRSSSGRSSSRRSSGGSRRSGGGSRRR